MKSITISFSSIISFSSTSAQTLAAVALLLGTLLGTAQAKPTYRFKSERQGGTVDRIAAKLEVRGNVIIMVEGREQKEKLSVAADLIYEEKTLEVASGESSTSRSIRYYEKATAKLSVGKGELEPALRPERQWIGVEIGAKTAVLYSPHGPLTRQELELIDDVPANSLLLDRFLPTKAVAVNDQWKHSEELMAVFLGLDVVGRSDVQSKLTEVTDAAAIMEMTGSVDGALFGVPSAIEVKAKYRFDRKTNRIDWFGLLIKEKRDVSEIEDGVDAVGRLQMQIVPQSQPTKLTAAALKDLPERSDVGLLQLAFTSAGGQWQLTYDRSWHVYVDHKELANLRLVDRGDLITQCNVGTLPGVPADKLATLAEFQADVKQLLGKQFGQFTQASQKENEAGYRVYRTVVEGEISQVPIHWYYYLVADHKGRQAVLAFTLRGEQAKQIGTADRDLVNSLRFMDPQIARKSQ